jgi:hypothetical protein
LAKNIQLHHQPNFWLRRNGDMVRKKINGGKGLIEVNKFENIFKLLCIEV